MTTERYVTTGPGAQKMRDRLRQIREVERPQNVQDIETAREHGDLRENAEYHAAKERQGFLNDEMRDIEDKLSRLQVIDPSTLDGDRIVFGATVTLLNIDTDEQVTYQIIGEDESDLRNNTISYKAPLSRALIGKEVGDEVVFHVPGGSRTYEVLEVEFK